MKFQYYAYFAIFFFCYQLTRARTRYKILQPTNTHFHSITISFLQHCQQIQHFLKLRITHVLLANQKAHRRPTWQAPIFADKLKLRLDVVDQQCHIAIQIEIGHLKDQRITEHGHSAHAIHFRGAQRTNGSRWSTGEANLFVDSQLLEDLDQLGGWPDLHRFNLYGINRLNYMDSNVINKKNCAF